MEILSERWHYEYWRQGLHISGEYALNLMNVSGEIQTLSATLYFKNNKYKPNCCIFKLHDSNKSFHFHFQKSNGDAEW